MSVTFILGNHRSGTTWLYQLLAGTRAFSVLTAHHVIDWPAWKVWADGGPTPDAAALAHRFAALGIRSRLDDGVSITPELPEEYGYLLNNAGLGSATSSRNVHLLREVVALLGRDGRPVLLKNPWDYGNFRVLSQLFPDARFVFIHRHPWRVIHSLGHMFQSMFAQQDPYGSLLSQRYVRNWAAPWRRRLFQWLARGGFGWTLEGIAFGVVAANRHYAAYADRVPAGRAITLRYEDLCAEPERELSRILIFCGVDSVAPSVPPRTGEGVVHPIVTRRAPRWAWAMRDYLDRFGYAVDGSVGEEGCR